MHGKSLFFLAVVCFIFLILIGSFLCEKELERLAKSRERSFLSLQACLMQLESDSFEKFDKSGKSISFEDLLSYYTDISQSQWMKITYGNIWFTPQIRLETGNPSRIYETKNFPVSIFMSDRLEVDSNDYIVHWVKSGRVVDSK